MQPLYLSLIAASLYAASTVYQGRQLLQRSVPERRIVATLGIFALTAQLACLYLQLVTPTGLALDFFNASSAAYWLIDEGLEVLCDWMVPIALISATGPAA